MEIRCIGFLPPLVGLELNTDFNTFRLSQVLWREAKRDEVVFLVDEKRKIAFGRAVILSLDTGTLVEMCRSHGSNNHMLLGQTGADVPEKMMAILRKIYGPHVATDTKKTTVVYLRRIE